MSSGDINVITIIIFVIIIIIIICHYFVQLIYNYIDEIKHDSMANNVAVIYGYNNNNYYYYYYYYYYYFRLCIFCSKFSFLVAGLAGSILFCCANSAFRLR